MRLITYTDPRRLDLHPEWNLIRSTLHICATESLAKGLQDYYGPSSKDGLSRVTAISVNLLLSKLLPEWLSEPAQVMQYARLRAILRGLQHEHEHRQLVHAFRHNLSDVLSAIRLLEESGLTPSDLDVRTLEERLFVRLWQEMSKYDPCIKSLRKSLFRSLRNPHVMQTELVHALQEAAWTLRQKHPLAAQALQRAYLALLKNRRLILHGFYFITPLQQQLFNLLHNAGFELIGLACWDARRGELFRAWEAFYPGEKGSTEGPEPEPAGRFFAEVVRGAPEAPEVPSQLRIVRYPDLGAFLAHIRQDQQRPESVREKLCSPMADELNDILKEYYPDRYPDRHFLSYPVGKFLVQLVKMWDDSAPPETPRDQRLRITPGGLFDCFASGLLRVPNRGKGDPIEGRQLTDSLKKLLPFFEGCETRSDWMKRCQQLREAYEAARHFDACEEPGTPRQHARQLLANPLRRISYLNVSRDEIEKVVALIGHLFTIADRLHEEQKTTLAAYLQKLAALLEEGGHDKALLREEKELFDEMLNALRTAPADDRELLPTEDLGHALAFYLGVVAKKSDDQLVAPLVAADGLPLRDRERPVHLCLLAEGALPRQTPAFPWPLTRRSFRNANHWAVELLRRREDTSADASLYLFYSALAFSKQVTLSWVAEWRDEPVQESFYVLMMRMAGVRQVDASYGLWQSGEVAANEVVHPDDSQQTNLADVPPHAAAEFEVCPMRFCYSYTASGGPVYSSPFHLDFVYSGLLAWYRSIKSVDLEEAARKLDRFFPQFTRVRKQDLKERYGDLGEYGWTDQWGGRQYPAALRRVFLLGLFSNPKYREVISKPERYASVLNRLREAIQREEFGPTPGYHCRYCPHNTYCRATAFPVDE